MKLILFGGLFQIIGVISIGILFIVSDSPFTEMVIRRSFFIIIYGLMLIAWGTVKLVKGIKTRRIARPFLAILISIFIGFLTLGFVSVVSLLSGSPNPLLATRADANIFLAAFIFFGFLLLVALEELGIVPKKLQ